MTTTTTTWTFPKDDDSGNNNAVMITTMLLIRSAFRGNERGLQLQQPHFYHPESIDNTWMPSFFGMQLNHRQLG
jgi:hypothetical protein